MTPRRHAARAQSGQIMPMASMLMVVIIGMAAFAIDGSNIYSQHRKLQADLDVAVKVAAAEMWITDPSSPAYTATAQTAIAAAGLVLANDGYANTLTITSSAVISPGSSGFCGTDVNAGILICNPPQKGLFAGSPHYDYVEGRLSRDVGGFFGGAIGLGKTHIGVRAVAWHGGFHEPYALIGLNNVPNACSVNVGNGSLRIDGSIVGDALTCSSPVLSVSGHSDEAGSGNSNQIAGQGGTNQNVPPVTDPFSPTGSITSTEPVTIVPDTQPAIPPECYNEVVNYIPTITLANLSANPQNLPPGSHFYFPPADGAYGVVPVNGPVGGSSGVIEFLPRCNGTAKGQPGVYYITGGTLRPGYVFINTFDSVFIFDSTSATELIHDTGTAQWALGAPASGPYQGIALAQSRTGPEPPCPAGSTTFNYSNRITFTGAYASGGFAANGVVDMPCTHVSAQHSSSFSVEGILVAWDVNAGGNADLNFTVHYNPQGLPVDRGSVLVE